MPMKLRPVWTQATPVVPEPMKGSRTVAPSGRNDRHQSIKSSGFCVGCCLFMRPYAAHRAILNVRGAVFRLVHAISKSPPLNFCTLSQMSQPRTGGSG